MKKIYFIFFAIITLSACKKDAADNGCMSQTANIAQVSAAVNDTVLRLMHANNISANNQVFVSYVSYHALNQAQVDTKYQIVYSTQIKNGLPVFLDDIAYYFESGEINQVSGKPYSAINLDTKSSQKLPALRQLFLNEAINKNSYNAGIRDSCFVAQFGYLNANINSAETTVSFVKAWKVKPLHSNYPVGYFRDDNGKTLYFSSGAIVF